MLVLEVFQNIEEQRVHNSRLEHNFEHSQLGE